MTLSSEFKVNDADKELNTYIEKDKNNTEVLYSNTNISLKDSVNYNFNDKNNITLLNYDDAVKKTGKDINQKILSCLNWYYEGLGEYDNNVTKDDIASEFYLDDNVNYKIYGHPEKWDLNYNQSWGNCGIILI